MGKADLAQAGSSNQGNPDSRTAAWGVVSLPPPFFVAGSSIFWGSGHSISDSESAAGEGGLLASSPLFTTSGALGQCEAGILGQCEAGILGQCEAGILGQCEAGILGWCEAGILG
ncbi:UNVERIFIED_CONTAM: hypothetical protein FKN15_007469 [Acipenser sinensis]